MQYLQSDTLLHGGQYKIVRFISAGGFGCTYEAYDTLMETRVAIKEFFVKDYCNRDEATSQITSEMLSYIRQVAAALNNGVLSTKDIRNRNDYLRTLRAEKRGELIRVRQGVYAEPSFVISTMIDVEKIVPNGIVCMYNAWSYYELTTTNNLSTETLL